jgi:hypothetical protein
MVSRLNAEGAKVLAEGRRGILPGDKIQKLGRLPLVFFSRILEFRTRVNHPQEGFSKFPLCGPPRLPLHALR